MDSALAGFATEFRVPSSFRAAAWPLPEPSAVNSAGAARAADSESGSDSYPKACMRSSADVGELMLNGTTALICPPEINRSDAAIPLTNTDVPAYTNGKTPSADAGSDTPSGGPR